MSKCVLVVDDDASVRRSFENLLHQANYHAQLAADGEQALARVAEGNIDLVLLDLNLSNESGWDVFKQLTTDHPLIPVVIVTGLSNQHQTAAAAGASALLEKPVEPADFLRTIEELVIQPNENRLGHLTRQVGSDRHSARTGGTNTDHQDCSIPGAGSDLHRADRRDKSWITSGGRELDPTRNAAACARNRRSAAWDGSPIALPAGSNERQSCVSSPAIESKATIELIGWCLLVAGLITLIVETAPAAVLPLTITGCVAGLCAVVLRAARWLVRRAHSVAMPAFVVISSLFLSHSLMACVCPEWRFGDYVVAALATAILAAAFAICLELLHSTRAGRTNRTPEDGSGNGPRVMPRANSGHVDCNRLP